MYIEPQKYVNMAQKLENTKNFFEYFFTNRKNIRYEKIYKLYENAASLYKLLNNTQLTIKYYDLAYKYLIMSIENNNYNEYNVHCIKILLNNMAEMYEKVDYIKSITYYFPNNKLLFGK